MISETGAEPGLQVLFADEDVVLCISARRALQRAGYSVALTHDGSGVIERFVDGRFDLVVAGAELPVLNGLQVLREIRKQNSLIPVILFGDAPELSALAIDEGAFAYLKTPSGSYVELIETIDRALADRHRAPKADAPVPSPDLDDSRLLASLRNLVESMRTDELPVVVQFLLDTSAKLLRAEHAVLLLTDSDAGLTLHHALGFGDQSAAARDFIENVGDGFGWRVAKERKTLSDHRVRAVGHAQVRFAGTPLIVHNELLGVLIAYPLPDEQIESSRLAWLETLAAQGAIAVKMSRLGEENQRLTQSDPVTGMLKSSVFLDLADHEFRRSWRYNQPISAIVVEIDGLEDISSNRGRPTANRVLHEVATVCRNTVRSIDLVGRYGEDLIALLLLMTDRAGAKSAAARLRAGVDSLNLSDSRGSLRVTVSLGACSYPREDCASVFDLLNTAQDALRFAKRGGVNQVVQV